MKKDFIHNGNFIAFKSMILNGKFIKDKIPSIINGHFHCNYLDLTSLEGSPIEVKGNFNCISNPLISLEGGPRKLGLKMFSGLEIEKEFINSVSYINNYWIDLLKYMIKEKIDLQEIKSWPDGFLNDEIIKSAKGLSKFNL